MKIRKSAILALLAGSSTLPTSPVRACDHVRYFTYRPVVRHYSPPIVVTRPVIVEKPVVIEKTVIIEKPVVVAPVPEVVEPSVVVKQPGIREAAFPAQRIGLRAGATYQLTTRFLGNETGAVSLVMEGVTLDCQIVQWSPTGVTFIVPNVVMSPSMSGEVIVQRADGNPVKVAAVQLLAKPDLAQVLPSAGATPEQLTTDVAPSAPMAQTVIAEIE